MASEPTVASVHPDPPGPGLTGRVLRGSVYSGLGQVAVLSASFVATPLIIRWAGAEVYGVLALVNIVVGYLTFADFGMGTASTTFGAGAHARGDEDDERSVVVTALLIACGSAAVSAVALGLAASALTTRVLEVPEDLRGATVVSLQLAALGFFVRSAANVLNTPQLVRLRMGVYTAISTTGSLLQILLAPVAIAFGFGLIGAVTGIVLATLALASMHFMASNRLLPRLLAGRPSLVLARRFVSFGSGLVVSSLAGMMLTSGEKLLLTHYASVTELAYYTVAFTVASLLALGPQAIGPWLLPAFSKLHGNGDRARAAVLFDRVLRGGVLYAAPAIAAIWLCGEPFLRLWAGPEFAAAGASALTVLALGHGANVLAFVPYSVLLASGRSGVVARLHLAEVIPYLVLAALLAAPFGATGAGLAWSIRATVDAVAMFWLARREVGLSPRALFARWPALAGVFAVLAVPVVLAQASAPVAEAVAAGVALPAYAIAAFFWILDDAEREYVRSYGRRVRRLGGLEPRGNAP